MRLQRGKFTAFNEMVQFLSSHPIRIPRLARNWIGFGEKAIQYTPEYPFKLKAF